MLLWAQRRNLLQATYCPGQMRPSRPYARAWLKRALLVRLGPTADEVMSAKQAMSKRGVTSPAIHGVFVGIEALVRQKRAPRDASAFREMDAKALSDVAAEILEQRGLSHGLSHESAASEGTTTLAGVAGGFLNAYDDAVRAEPVGYLFLERLAFTPAGIERGELLSSLPLAAGEEIEVEQREWSDTAEEMQKIVTDYQEDFSEEGVAEKSEAVQAVANESQRASAFDTSFTASGGYGPVSVTAGAGFSLAETTTSSEEFSRSHSIALTRKASSRTRKEHKVSFRISTSSGSEAKSAKKIKNASEKAIRIDYYQLLRKWQVDLHRYGVRLTYDLTVPEPGSEVLGRILEVGEIRRALGEGFGKEASLGWARFTLTPRQVTRRSYATLAADYGASVPEPPPEEGYFEMVCQRDWQTPEQAANYQVTSFEVNVPEGYVVDSVSRKAWHGWFNDAKRFDWKSGNDVSRYKDRAGPFQYVVGAQHLVSFLVRLRIRTKLTTEAFAAWQMKVWTLLRDAANLRYAERRQMLEDRLRTLTEEIGSQDPLSLRKREREEIMRGVLVWLFGPDFAFSPKGLPATLTGEEGAVLNAAVWARVSDHGKVIQFLHHAIEWENMVYVLYPYFWSHPARWDLKKDLDHPDLQHRAFLKAGAARVVLTIRPGFEKAFLSFMETGGFDALPPDHPYMTMAEELAAFAKTNYPGIPAANPEGAESAEQGQTIGTWFEYTPTSAMDIGVGDALPEA